MAVLFDGIPGYSGKPGCRAVRTSTTPTRSSATALQNLPRQADTRSAYNAANLGLQQRGFYNMTQQWFGNRDVSGAATDTVVVNEAVVLTGTTASYLAGAPIKSASTVTVLDASGTTVAGTDYTLDMPNGSIVRTASSTIPSGATVSVSYTYTRNAEFDKLWNLWPKGNGYQHIEAFRMMRLSTRTPAGQAEATRIKAAVVWGQNPAVTEPNQTRGPRGSRESRPAGLRRHVRDRDCSGEAQGDRRRRTCFPACSHVEEAGSVTNSGRWIQWRERATAPKGNSKADLELLLRFAKALNDCRRASATSRISGRPCRPFRRCTTAPPAPTRGPCCTQQVRLGRRRGSMEDVTGHRLTRASTLIG